MNLRRKLLAATALFAVAVSATVIAACIRAGDAHDFDWDEDGYPLDEDGLDGQYDDDWGDDVST